ncbi:MAG: RsmB/NOP family class I SAM-dependent RNA methyltransferase [Candidatus Woesearchaeota archaeon]
MNVFLKRYKDMGHDIDPEKITLRYVIRVNTLKISEDDLIARLKKKKVRLEKIPFTDSGYWADSEFSLSSTAEYLHGYFYSQEAASQMPAIALSPKKGESVLDMCAAPGSKTTQLAAMMQNHGTLIALDSNMSRISALRNNLERCGVRDCLVYHKDAIHVADLGMEFDKILLDAPCSGNFVTDPGWFDKRSLEGVQSMVKTQKALLKAAVNILKPGGALVYSTCSMEPEEDEEVIEWALENLPVKLIETGLKAGKPGTTPATALCKRFWPDTEKTQGFFIAKMIRS